MIKIAPSILSADFARLGEEIARVDRAGAGMIHIDVMDGVFVPNITLGLPVVKSVRPYSALPFDVHLMIVDPWKYTAQFVQAGGDYVTFHLEAVEDPARVVETLKEIRSLGAKAGLSIKPATPASALFPYLEYLDMIMVMTVEPGFGNQKMMPECLDKVQELRAEAERRGYNTLLAIDGGMNASTKEMVWAAGVDMAVAGSAVFGAADAAEMIRVLGGA